MNHLRALVNFEAALTKAKGKRNKADALRVIEDWARAELRDRRRKVDDEAVQKVRGMSEDGDSVADIAERVELSQPTVRRILARTGRFVR